MTASQIPFISVPFKRTDDIDWIEPLKRYIVHHYQDDPEKYTQETYTLNRLRQDIRGAGKDITGRDLLYRYYGQLELLDLRFPIDEKHVKILFTWYDAFNGKGTSQYSLAYEKASVIFNFAATLSCLASVQNRAEPDGRKKAFHFLQASAGMFEYINDNFLHAPSLDLSKETVHFLAELMLAQAQECFVENSIREKKKDGLIAKLASHAVWVYSNLVDDLQESTNKGLMVDKSWLSMCQIKHLYYQALAQKYKASACEQDGQYGEQVARLTVAENVSKEASGKLATTFLQQVQQLQSSNNNGNSNTMPADSGSVMQELCKSLSATCHEKLAAATRDNDLIYHEQVPQESILQPIDRLKAVQPLPMSDLYGQTEMAKIIGPDLFTKLIPLSIHQSASLYSEEQAKLVRSEAEKCDLAKAELRTSLDYMKLPQSLNKFKWTTANSSGVNQNNNNNNNNSDHEQQKQLATFMLPPDEVYTWADSIYQQEHDHQHNIKYLMDTLESLKTTIRSSLDDIQLKMDQEMRECESMRVKYGDLWSQAPSGALTNHFRQDLKNHRQSMESGTQSDSQLYHQYTDIKKEIDVLRLGSKNDQLGLSFTNYLHLIIENENNKTQKKETDIDSLLDLVDDSDSNQQQQKDAALACKEKIQRIEAMVDKLYKLEKDRYETLQDLKERTKQDDISQLLILNKKSNTEQQQIFASELEKYRPHQQRIHATIHQQKQMIQELTTTFKSLMEGEEAKALQSKWDKMERQKKKLTDQYKFAKDTYFEIQEGLGKGIQFYTSLKEVVQSLCNNCKGFIQDRDRERSRLVEELERTQSNREQTLLKEKLNMYSSPSSSSPITTTSLASAPDMSLLTQQTQQLSMNNATRPLSQQQTIPMNYNSFSQGGGVGHPTPPPPPQQQQQQQQQYSQPITSLPLMPPVPATPQTSFYNNNNNNNNNTMSNVPPPIPAKEYPSTPLSSMNPTVSPSTHLTYQQSPMIPPSPYNNNPPFIQQPTYSPQQQQQQPSHINNNNMMPPPSGYQQQQQPPPPSNYYQHTIPTNNWNQYPSYPTQQQTLPMQPPPQQQQQHHQQQQQYHQQQQQQPYWNNNNSLMD
ncbi:BRO1-like domain-containing protein [Cunninghamella echinulata]|nr:BRO1-like domain-containing protein [Cunninghamella echinulata]